MKFLLSRQAEGALEQLGTISTAGEPGWRIEF
jgi:hypothetical protein